jgi:putative DNA primase/helicase
MTATATTRKTVSKARPCALCAGVDGCSTEADVPGGGLLMCRRRKGEQLGFVYLGQATGDPQFALYRREDDPVLRERHGNGNGKPRIVATYDYRDERGVLLYQSVRFEPKDFRQRQPNGNGWTWNLRGVRRVLYRLPELLAAPPDCAVFVVEGEKDVESLRGLECVATTNAMGAGKWIPQYSESLRGRHVIILPDNDQPGRDHARQVARMLGGVAASVKVVELPGLPEKGDVSDWLAAGGNKVQLLELAQDTDPWRPVRDGEESQDWEEPAPLGARYPVPAFPVHLLPGWVEDWVSALAEATQTPPALAAALELGICGAALAKKARVRVREGWDEPTNLLVVVALAPGERKTAVFAESIAPVQEFERQEQARLAPQP